MINLIKNAFKFQTHGTVRIFLAFDLAKNFLHVHVVDSGTGIRKVDIPKIFDGFGTPQRNEILSNQSDGLGLMICKNLVEINGGSIRVRSKGRN